LPFEKVVEHDNGRETDRKGRQNEQSGEKKFKR
jgi:hypothetical protein